MYLQEMMNGAMVNSSMGSIVDSRESRRVEVLGRLYKLATRDSYRVSIGGLHRAYTEFKSDAQVSIEKEAGLKAALNKVSKAPAGVRYVVAFREWEDAHTELFLYGQSNIELVDSFIKGLLEHKANKLGGIRGNDIDKEIAHGEEVCDILYSLSKKYASIQLPFKAEMDRYK